MPESKKVRPNKHKTVETCFSSTGFSLNTYFWRKNESNWKCIFFMFQGEKKNICWNHHLVLFGLVLYLPTYLPFKKKNTCNNQPDVMYRQVNICQPHGSAMGFWSKSPLSLEIHDGSRETTGYFTRLAKRRWIYINQSHGSPMIGAVVP